MYIINWMKEKKTSFLIIFLVITMVLTTVTICSTITANATSIDCFKIQIGKKTVAYVSSEEEGKKVVDNIKNYYIKKGEKVLSVKLDPKVKILPVSFSYKKGEKKPVIEKDVKKITDDILTGGKSTKHIKVKDGDTIWSIASDNGTTVDKLLKDNNMTEEQSIMPGDEILYKTKAPLLKITVKKEVVRTKDIPFKKEIEKSDSMYDDESKIKKEGKKGKEKVTDEVTLVDGKEVNTKTLKSKVLEKPSTEIVIKGTKKRPTKLRLPVYASITSYFGYRVGPLAGLGSNEFHKGIDMGVGYGTPVRAAEDGVVVSSGYNGGYGKCVIIQHDNGMETLYGHNSSLAVSAGERVSRGDVVAYAGSTGWSTGTHCHFEVHIDGQAVNPLDYAE